jgi:hypothetical protein
MRKIATVMAGAAAAVLLLSGNASALCPPNTVGPLASVAAADGEPVGGPVDAAVEAAMSRPQICAHVIEEEIPLAVGEAPAAVDEPLPMTDTLQTVPENRTYVTAYVDGQPVLVDPDTRAVVDVMK